MLRYVDHGEATIWVETDRACVVTIDAGPLSASSATWAVHGHHYALLQLSGLGEGTVTPYEVRLDDTLVWPEPDSPYPPSVIRTLTPASSLRLVFGSCRRWAPYDEAGLEEYGAETGMIVVQPFTHREGRVRFSVPVFGADEWPCRSLNDIALTVGERVIVVDVIGNELLVKSTQKNALEN